MIKSETGFDHKAETLKYITSHLHWMVAELLKNDYFGLQVKCLQ